MGTGQLLEHILTRDLSGIGRGCVSSYDCVTSVEEARALVDQCRDAVVGGDAGERSVLVGNCVEERLDHVG